MPFSPDICTDSVPEVGSACIVRCYWDPGRKALRGYDHRRTWGQNSSVSKLYAEPLVLGRIPQSKAAARGEVHNSGSDWGCPASMRVAAEYSRWCLYMQQLGGVHAEVANLHGAEAQ